MGSTTRKNKPVIILLVIGLILFVNPLLTAAQDSTTMAQIRSAEDQLSAILESNNTEALDEMLYPTFTVQTAAGSVTAKDQLMSGFRNGKNPYLKFRPMAERITAVNDSTVITSGNELYAHRSDPEPVQDRTRFFYHIWIKEDGQWYLAGRIIAPLPEK